MKAGRGWTFSSLSSGTMLGLCASVQSLIRTIGPTAGGFLYVNYGLSSLGLLQLIVNGTVFVYLLSRRLRNSAKDDWNLFFMSRKHLPNSRLFFKLQDILSKTEIRSNHRSLFQSNLLFYKWTQARRWPLDGSTLLIVAPLWISLLLSRMNWKWYGLSKTHSWNILRFIVKGILLERLFLVNLLKVYLCKFQCK